MQLVRLKNLTIPKVYFIRNDIQRKNISKMNIIITQNYSTSLTHIVWHSLINQYDKYTNNR